MSLYKKNIYELINDKANDEVIIDKVNTLNLADMYTLTLFLIMQDNKDMFELLLTNNCIKDKLDVTDKNSWETNFDDLLDYCNNNYYCYYYYEKLNQVKNNNKLKLK